MKDNKFNLICCSLFMNGLILCIVSVFMHELVVEEDRHVISETISHEVVQEVCPRCQAEADSELTSELEPIVEYVPPALNESSSEEDFMWMSSEDKYLLAQVILLEGGGESKECQYAIGSIIINRWLTGKYESLHDIIYEEGQFAVTSYIPYTAPSDLQIAIVNDLLRKGPSIPPYVLYFRANYYHSFGEPYMYIDNTYFSYNRNLMLEYLEDEYNR